MVALITSWWPRWVEFFALCWFIQAQGDDILFPFIDETVNHNLGYVGSPPAARVWPGPADFIAPTTPVLSGAYMANVAGLREALLATGLRTREEAESALDAGQYPAIAQNLAEHLRKWHWMRDRDLLFEPWDTRGRVIETALKTDPIAADWRHEDQFIYDSARISVPTLVLFGERDPNVDRGDAEQFFSHLNTKEKRLVEIPGADHCAHIEDTHDAWINEVVTFVGKYR